jgi:putative redox protein
MSRNVVVTSQPLKYDQTIAIGPHILHSDEPSDIGGKDAGPNAQELLMASLGACASITVQMYAERKQWPLEGVRIALSYARVIAEGPTDSGASVGMVDRIEVELVLSGNLSAEQRNRLLEIANHCPVHRMLTSHVETNITLLAPVSSSPAD